MSPTDQHLAAQAALYGSSAADLAKDLPEIGQGLAEQLADLSCNPTPERCERMAIHLGGAQRAVLRLREALRCEAAGKVHFLPESAPAIDACHSVAQQERGHGQ